MKVKNLRATSGCPHYRGLEAKCDSQTKCATNGCNERATRACHLIAANQNADRGVRLIAYLCPRCNPRYDCILNIRSNAVVYEMPDCKCGVWP